MCCENADIKNIYLCYDTYMCSMYIQVMFKHINTTRKTVFVLSSTLV